MIELDALRTPAVYERICLYLPVADRAKLAVAIWKPKLYTEDTLARLRRLKFIK